MDLSLNPSKILGTLSIAVIVLVSLTHCNEEKQETKVQNLCGRLRTAGYTVPCGDIILRKGDALNITCNLYEDTLKKYGQDAASRLFFTRNNNSIPPNMIEVINSTSIRLYIENHPTTENDNYFCTLHIPENKTDTLVCMNVIVVGVPPQEVTDFSCVSRNYENMTCTWSLPNNYCKTDYKLSYSLKKRAARNIHYDCKPFVMDDGRMACFWNISTSPPYRQVYPLYYFTLQMNNSLGERTFNYTFEHFKNVIPNAPVDLKVAATSPHSVHLSWKVPKELYGFSCGVYHRVLYYCHYEKDWKEGGLITDAIKNRTIEYDVVGLKYAHCACTFRVGILSAVADINDTRLWSANASKIVWTKSKIPDSPPETTLGSFEIIDAKNSLIDIYVYWKQIEEHMKNGQDFKYYLELANYSTMNRSETASISKFRNLEISNYTVNIWSQNEEGLSAEHSTIVIPAPSKLLSKPTTFRMVAHGEKLYELSWDSPKTNSHSITNYTIFMCSSSQPNMCKGDFGWVTVPYNYFRYNQSVNSDKMYQFAISANGYNGSSGMLWAECTIYPDRTQDKLNQVWIETVGHDFIEVSWRLSCTDYIGIIEGYDIVYCPIVKAQTECSGANKTQTIKGGISINKGRITGLKPYTSYKLQVRFIINNGTYSQWSVEKYNTTSEAAPSSPPQNVRVLSKTNSSISLKWDQPLSMNGKLKFYRVYYNILGQELRFNETEVDNYTLHGLTSYATYNISVDACTTACSNRSKDLQVTTLMGRPGDIMKPLIESFNSSVIIFSWKEPDKPRGKLDYYQLHFMQKLGSPNDTDDFTINVTNTKHYSISCDSKSNSRSYVSIRAVNIINGEHFPGPWSLPLQTYCYQSSSLIYVIIGISLIFVAVLLFMGGKKSYELIINLKIIPKLPPGLQHDVDHSLVMSEKKPEDKDRNTKADRVSLLDPLSGNESGISSGHESITSSVESGGTLISGGSDSGSEQPLSLSEDTRKNSLRQRNVPSKGYVVMPDPLLSSTITKGGKQSPASGNYCMLGVAPSVQPEPEHQYVPITETSTNLPYISDLPTQSPQYVLTGDLIKSTNPGYIPFTAAEPAPKNTGYVVAGEIGKTTTGYIPFSAAESAPKNTGYVVAGVPKDLLAPLKED